MHAFMRSQLVQPGGFADRRGQPDLYYTMFGLLFAAATEMPIDLNATERYLQSFAPQSLDLVHLASLTRSHLLLKYLRRPHLATWPRQTLPPTLRNAYNALDTGELERFPHRDPRSPYSQMLRWSLAEDLGLNYIHQNLDQYRQPDGMFANLPGDDAPAVNATAAALVLLNANGADRRTLQPDLQRLADLQTPEGGFPAMPSTPVADLLSTATASLALTCCQHPLPYSLKPFLRQTITPAGGFAAIPGDDAPDLEYTIYGLMAMGLTR
jgi:prenyltransferase beta subunit